MAELGTSICQASKGSRKTFPVSQTIAIFEGVREQACLNASATLSHGKRGEVERHKYSVGFQSAAASQKLAWFLKISEDTSLCHPQRRTGMSL